MGSFQGAARNEEVSMGILGELAPGFRASGTEGREQGKTLWFKFPPLLNVCATFLHHPQRSQHHRASKDAKNLQECPKPLILNVPRVRLQSP